MNDLFNLVLLLAATLLTGTLTGYAIARSRNKAVRRKSKSNTKKDGELRERERSMSVYKLVSKLSATLNYEKVLETAMDMSSTALAAASESGERLVSATFLFATDESDPGRTRLRVGSARRFTPADLRILLDGKSGLLARSIEQGEPQGSKEVSEDPELGRIIALRSCNGAYLIPLRSGLDTFGVLAFAHPDADFFTIERRETLDIIGNQAMIALQNAQLYRNLEQEKERMMEIQEEARKKLARDLHDGPTQSVAAIAMRVNFARRLMSRDASAAIDELSKIEDLARRTTKEIRHMLFTLRPLVLESKGLVAALEAMAEKMGDTYDQNVIIDADRSLEGKIEMGKQAVIFYIVEEAVNNARKHGEAAHIWVKIKSLQPDIALLAVEDDGVGFNVGAVDATYESRGSLGMINMRERAELINGVLHIDSAEGKGTRIHVAIPLTEEAHDRLRNRQVS
jgi:signal transduction histidine kinase